MATKTLEQTVAELADQEAIRDGCVRVRTNLYSVPAKPGRTVEVRLYASRVEVRDEGQGIACHERCYERNQQVLELEHYLDVLERKPGALAGSKPLAAWRQRGLWPESYDRLLEDLIRRHGKQSGTRQMIQVLSLIKPYGHERVRTAVEEAITLGCSDAAAIRHLAGTADLTHARSAIIELGALSRFERPLPVMTTTGCSARRWHHERADCGSGSGHHWAAVQGVASADRRRAVRPTRRTGGARAPDASRLPRSTAAN